MTRPGPPACPRCGAAALARLRFSDGWALRWWHCLRCGWNSDEAGVHDFDDLTERLRAAREEER